MGCIMAFAVGCYVISCCCCDDAGSLDELASAIQVLVALLLNSPARPAVGSLPYAAEAVAAMQEVGRRAKSLACPDWPEQDSYDAAAMPVAALLPAAACSCLLLADYVRRPRCALQLLPKLGSLTRGLLQRML